MSIAAIVKFKNRKYGIRKAVNDINYPYIFWDFKREQFVRSGSVDTDGYFLFLNLTIAAILTISP